MTRISVPLASAALLLPMMFFLQVSADASSVADPTPFCERVKLVLTGNALHPPYQEKVALQICGRLDAPLTEETRKITHAAFCSAFRAGLRSSAASNTVPSEERTAFIDLLEKLCGNVPEEQPSCPLPKEQSLVKMEACTQAGGEPVMKSDASCTYYVGCRRVHASSVSSAIACNASAGFRSAYWQCYDGVESKQGGDTSCKSSTTWSQYARDFCSGHCAKGSDGVEKCGVNTFSVSGECGSSSCSAGKIPPFSSEPVFQDSRPETCESLQGRMDVYIRAGSMNDPTFVALKNRYSKMCIEPKVQFQEPKAPFQIEPLTCRDLRLKLTTLAKANKTDSEEYVALKAKFASCGKENAIPPAGYEDEVLTVLDAYDNPFPDTDLRDREGKAAAELYRRGVIGGFPDGEFKGLRNVTKAELAKFALLARYGAVADVRNNGRFPDVLDGQWYTKFVVTAAEKGIVSGRPDGLFRPADTVNTAEFLKMLALTFDLPRNLPHDYADVSGGDWFAPYAGIALNYDLLPGRAGKLLPAKPMSRTEVAVALYQYFKYRDAGDVGGRAQGKLNVSGGGGTAE